MLNHPLTTPEELQQDIKNRIYKLILFCIVLNSLTWYPQIKSYLYGYTKAESHFYWTIALNVYALSGGAILAYFAFITFPTDKVFKLFLITRLWDIPGNFVDQNYIDKYDILIWSVKLVLSLTVLTLIIQKLKHKKPDYI